MSLNLFDILIAAALSGGGGGGGSASWGNIGGDITDQSDLVSALALKLSKVVVADDYNTTSSGYSKGDYCMYNGALYVANENIAVGAVWDESKWTNKTLEELFSEKQPKHKYIVDNETAFTLNPGETRRVTGTPASITVTLAAPDLDSDIEPHCRLKFEAGSSFASLSVTPPEGYTIVYKDGSLSPQIGKFYEVDYCYLDDANIGCVVFPWTI